MIAYDYVLKQTLPKILRIKMKSDIYIRKIIENTGLSKKEIQDKVEEKKKELKGLISDEGALFIIAKEYGVDVKEETKDLLDEVEINVADIRPNMKNIMLAGRIKLINDIYEFSRKQGGNGRVGSFILSDNTGDIRITLWDDQTDILSNSQFSINEVVKIVNGYAKQGRNNVVEIHVGKYSKMLLSPEDVDYKKLPKISQNVIEIKEITSNLKNVSVKGRVMQKYPIREFTRKNGSDGKVCSLNLMDSSGSIRITFWNEDTEKTADIEVGNDLIISNLLPRISSLDSKTIELHASPSTYIESKNIELEIKVNDIDSISELQNKAGIFNFKGVVTSVENERKINLKSGDQVSFMSFNVSDDTGAIRVALWGEQVEEYRDIIKNGAGFKLNNILIKYSNFSNRNEVSLTKNSSIEPIDLDFKEPKPLKAIQKKSSSASNMFTGRYIDIKDINSPGFFEIKGYVVKELDKIVIYQACKKCFRKVENCACDQKESTENRMIFNLTLDDGTSTIRTTFFGEKAEKLIGEETDIIKEIEDTPDYSEFLQRKGKELIGKDIIVRGKVKFSDYTNKYEIAANTFKLLNINEELESIMEEIET